MANLITTALTFSKEVAQEYYINPLFMDNDDFRSGVTMETGIKSSKKLNQILNLENITLAYAEGESFTSSTGLTLTQKTLSVSDMKAQVDQNGKAFDNTVMQEFLKQGVDQNDVSDTEIERIILSVFIGAIRRDLFRQVWINDTAKNTLTAGVPTGTGDVNYNVYQGIWARTFADYASGAIPSAQLIDISSSVYQTQVPVKELETMSVTGTSGTANVTLNGAVYLATFDTNLTTTAANFVTAHAATILALSGEILVASAVADITFTSGVSGAPLTSSIANVSGDLAGTVAVTTPNVVSTTLKTDAAKTMFQEMVENSTNELLAYDTFDGTTVRGTADLADNELIAFHVTKSILFNYQSTLEALNGSDEQYRVLVNGVKLLQFRGIPIIVHPEWDKNIAASFFGVRKHRAMLTIAKNNVFGTDGDADETTLDVWYNIDKQRNYFRAEYKAGTQRLHEELITSAYAV
jgi:hypothetical protein